MQQPQGQGRYMLHVAPPLQDVGPLDLVNLVQGKLAAGIVGLSCTTCNGQQILGSTKVQYGHNLVIWVNRNNGTMTKTISALAEPADNDPLWGGNRCHVVLAHLGRNSV